MNDPNASLETSHLTSPPPGRQAAILLQVGAFSPVTIAHLRLFEAARDTLVASGMFVIGGYMSPVSDAYQKPGLAPAEHRLAMCRLAVAATPWLAVDNWEASVDRFVRTHEVASRVKAASPWPAQLYLVCGSDLVQAMRDPNRWPSESVEKLMNIVQLVVKPRQNHILPAENISTFLIENWVPHLSSSLVRQYLMKGFSIRHMVPDSVLEYIQVHRLYTSTPFNSAVRKLPRPIHT